MKNYYQILGIKYSSSPLDIKNAYKKLVLKFHPDKNEGDLFFENLFKDIQEAYECLSNDERKKSYDNQYIIFFKIENQPKKDVYPKTQKTTIEQRQKKSSLLPFFIFSILIFAILYIALKSNSKTQQTVVKQSIDLSSVPPENSDAKSPAPKVNLKNNAPTENASTNENIKKTDGIQENTTNLSSEEKEVLNFVKDHYKFYDRDHIFRKPLIKKIDDYNYEVSIEECLSKGDFKNIENFWDAKVLDVSINKDGNLEMGRRFHYNGTE